jgi:hypothetical protein
MLAKILVCAIAGTFLMTPLALGTGILPLNPIVNGDFDTFVTPGMAQALRPVADRCVGVGHQVIYPYRSNWAAYLVEGANGPLGLSGQVQDDPSGTADTLTGYPVEYVGGYVAAPSTTYECDPDQKDLEPVNAWETSRDRGLAWDMDASTQIKDASSDGDQEAVLGMDAGAFLYQSFASTQQAWSADFDRFEFTLGSGTIPSGALIQIVFSLTPGYQQSPWVGVFWEGTILFAVTDQMALDGGGHVQLDPIADGSIQCLDGYPPCEQFKADYDGAGGEKKHALLGEIRLVQTGFRNFGDPHANEPVVLDDIAYVGAKTMVETVPNLNPVN